MLLARSMVVDLPGSHSSKTSAPTVFVPTNVALCPSNDMKDTPIGRTERFWVRSVPLMFAVIVPLSGAVTYFGVMAKLAEIQPAGTVTLTGIVAETNVSLRVTTRPPAGAGFLSSTLPVTGPHSPGMDDLLKLNAGAESGDVIAYVNESADTWND